MAKSKYSFSKLDTYDQCGFRFKLKYIDKHYISGSSIALDIGQAIHKTEEEIALAIQENRPIDYVALKNKLILAKCEIQHKFPVDYITPDKSGMTYDEKIYEYLQTGIYRLENLMKANPHYKIVGIEQKFDFTFEGVTFGGAIDRVIYDTKNDKYIIQDIKTYAVPVEDKKLATPLQFVTYVLAAKELYGVTEDNVSCSYDLPFCNLTQAAGTKGFMTRGIKKLKNLLQAIDAQQYEPTPSPLCHWCEYCPTNPNQTEAGKNLCPYHSLWTREHKNFEKASEWQGLENHEKVLEHYLLKTSGNRV